MPMMGIKKVISTMRLKIKKRLPIILSVWLSGQRQWTRTRTRSRSRECDHVYQGLGKIPADLRLDQVCTDSSVQCTMYRRSRGYTSITGCNERCEARRGEARRLRSQRVQMHDFREEMCREKKRRARDACRKKKMFRHLALTAGEEAGRVMAFGLGGWGNEG